MWEGERGRRVPAVGTGGRLVFWGVGVKGAFPHVGEACWRLGVLSGGLAQRLTGRVGCGQCFPKKVVAPVCPASWGGKEQKHPHSFRADCLPRMAVARKS